MLTGGMSGSHYDVQVTENERKIVACWIDLCAPHGGDYSDYLSNPDVYNEYRKKVKYRSIPFLC
jgi:hypothetical protein